jgi:hypothetical protein
MYSADASKDVDIHTHYGFSCNIAGLRKNNGFSSRISILQKSGINVDSYTKELLKKRDEQRNKDKERKKKEKLKERE